MAPRAGRTLGCYITARQELGPLPPDTALFWHIDAFPTQSAARAQQGHRSTVVTSLGRVWLFTIAERSWRARAGDTMAVIHQSGRGRRYFYWLARPAVGA